MQGKPRRDASVQCETPVYFLNHVVDRLQAEPTDLQVQSLLQRGGCSPRQARVPRRPPRPFGEERRPEEKHSHRQEPESNSMGLRAKELHVVVV